VIQIPSISADHLDENRVKGMIPEATLYPWRQGDVPTDHFHWTTWVTLAAALCSRHAEACPVIETEGGRHITQWKWKH
jgi:hypothetical protein